MRTNAFQFVTGQALNAGFNSAAVGLNQVFGYTIQGVITGTPTGTFTLQASADPWYSNPTTAQLPSNWTTIANTSQAVSTAGTFIYNVSDPWYNWVRLVYVDGSSGTSTATLSATIDTKGQ